MHRVCRKRIKGYFTVEASMIIPLVIFLFSFIFYLTFYLYDRCVISQDAYILAFQGSICYDRSPEEIRNYVEGKSREQFGKKYLGFTDFSHSVQVDHFKVWVEAGGTVKASFIKSLLKQDNWAFGTIKSADRICPTDCVRKVRLIKSMTKGEEP